MPTKDEDAWKALEPLRREAAGAASAREEENVFRLRYGLSLEDLVTISENPHRSGTCGATNLSLSIFPRV